MKQIHKGEMTVSNPKKYRELVTSNVIYNESIIRGSKVEKLIEISEGLWEYICEVDLDNPRVQELMTFLPEKCGIEYTLTSLPDIKNLDEINTLDEAEDKLKKIKNILQTAPLKP